MKTVLLANTSHAVAWFYGMFHFRLSGLPTFCVQFRKRDVARPGLNPLYPREALVVRRALRNVGVFRAFLRSVVCG